MGDCYLLTWYIRVASRAAERLRTSKKCLNFIEWSRRVQASCGNEKCVSVCKSVAKDSN